MSQRSIIIFLLTSLLTTLHLPALPVLPDPDPATVQTFRPAPPATIPAFPEQSEASACPLDLPDDLFRDIKAACARPTKPAHHHRPDPDPFLGSQLHRARCCPVLAAWLYSAYAQTGLRAASPARTRDSTYDMPVLPDDSETCVGTLEKALGNRGVELTRPNETCDVVYCYCGIRLHPFSCPEAFGVDARGELVGGAAVGRLERDCSNGGYGGCSKCLNTLYFLSGDKSKRSNRTERTSKMHNRDCELMGLTWLLNKNRSAYIHTVSAVLRAIMMNTNDYSSGPAFCSLNSDGMPLAVDSSQINDQSSSTILGTHLYNYILSFSLFCLSILFLFILY